MLIYIHVNQLPFLSVISGKLNYISIFSLKKRAQDNVIKGLLRVIQRYMRRGMVAAHVHGDGEFDRETIKDALKPVHMKIRTLEEHCGVAERTIRAVKERTSCVTNRLPYRQYPKVTVKNLVELAGEMLNIMPSDHGVSDTLSPTAMIDSVEKFDFGMRHITFGSFVQGHAGTNNTQDERYVEAIAVRRVGRKNRMDTIL